jgi:hypothetical protein
MSDVGRYRQIYPRLWRHPAFAALNKTARELTLYLLSGPQTNRIGLFHFSIATAAEDLRIGAETLRERLADVQVTFDWRFDADAHVLYIPSWWRWNRPQNANVLSGNLKDLSEIPPCGLVDAFADNLQTLPLTFHETFIEGLRQRLPKRSRTQEPDQNPKQEPEPPDRASRAPRRENVSSTSNTDGDLNDATIGIAVEALSYVDANADINVIVDHVQYLGNQVKRPLSRATALRAIQAARNGYRGPA